MADLCSRQKRQIGGMQRADGWSKTRHRRTCLFRLSDRGHLPMCTGRRTSGIGIRGWSGGFHEMGGSSFGNLRIIWGR